MAFRTKLDYSSNRQIKQHLETFTYLSGGTIFGLPFDQLPSGANLETSAITQTYNNYVSTFSGNSTTTVYTWYDNVMQLGASSLSAITPSNSGVTQNTGPVFTANTTTTIDGNVVALNYSGVSFDVTCLAIYDLGGGAYSGTVNTPTLYILSAETTDFTGRTIWVDVSGITRTQDLIITNNPTVGYVWTCADSEGKGYWAAAGAGSSLWTAGTGSNAVVLANSGGYAGGNYSLSEGYATTATGNYGSHAEGNQTTASGNVSHAEGQQTIASGFISHAEGGNTIANGSGSHAEGEFTTASGTCSHSEGNSTTALGSYSHAEGLQTKALGNYGSHAEGRLTTASGLYGSHAEGSGTTASNTASHAEGYSTLASGYASHAEGWYSLASGLYSHAENGYTMALGDNSHSEGQDTTAYGSASHVEGNNSIASGSTSHAEGVYCVANGNASHAEGEKTTANGNKSHTEGYYTTAIGVYSHAGGAFTIASGNTSFVHGSGSTASGVSTIVLGSGITGASNNTTYVDYLNVSRVLSTAFANDIRIDASGNLTTNTSDERLKENINQLTGALDKVKNLQGVTYQWKDRSAGGDAVRLGFIAQQVEQVEPLLVFTNNNDENKYKGLHIDGIIPLLVEAVKELSSGSTINNGIETQTILAEDNNIDLNYNGTQQTAIDGGIRVLHAKGVDLSADFITDENGDWVTNNDLKPNSLTIPEYTPISSSDTNGNVGNITRDDNYLYVKTVNGWKRTNLESF